MERTSQTSWERKASKYKRYPSEQRRLRLAYDIRCMMDQSTDEEHERLKIALLKAIELLTPVQKDYLMLYFFEGKNMRQIGELRGVDKSTVSRTVTRARKRLYTYLQFTSERFLLTDSFVGQLTEKKRG